LTAERRLGIGSLLSIVGAVGIVLIPLLDWTRIESPWVFWLGFLFGVSAGSGVALVVSGLIGRRSGCR
jgi:hypothetical protein